MTKLTNMTARRDPNWSVAEAKARFSELHALARGGQPQRVSRYGKDAVVIVSAEVWDAKVAETAPRSARTLWDVFAPLQGSGLELDRAYGGLRETEFGQDD